VLPPPQRTCLCLPRPPASLLLPQPIASCVLPRPPRFGFAASGTRQWRQHRKIMAAVLDYSSATCVATLKGHSSRVHSVAFHPTAQLLATGSWDNTTRQRLVWRMFSRVWRDKVGMFTSVYSVANHITAPLLATGGTDTVILWSQCTLSVLCLRRQLPSHKLALLVPIIGPSYNKRSLSLSYIYCLGRRRRIPTVVANAAASQRSEFGINFIGDSRCRLWLSWRCNKI
jgi:hypothetical protein